MKLFVGYSKAPEQPQSSARPICQFHTMMSTGREPVTIYALLHIGAHRAMHYGTGEEKNTTAISRSGNRFNCDPARKRNCYDI